MKYSQSTDVSGSFPVEACVTTSKVLSPSWASHSMWCCQKTHIVGHKTFPHIHSFWSVSGSSFPSDEQLFLLSQLNIEALKFIFSLISLIEEKSFYTLCSPSYYMKSKAELLLHIKATSKRDCVCLHRCEQNRPSALLVPPPHGPTFHLYKVRWA